MPVKVKIRDSHFDGSAGPDEMGNMTRLIWRTFVKGHGHGAQSRGHGCVNQLKTECGQTGDGEHQISDPWYSPVEFYGAIVAHKRKEQKHKILKREHHGRHGIRVQHVQDGQFPVFEDEFRNSGALPSFTEKSIGR